MRAATVINADIGKLRARCDEFSAWLDELKAMLPEGERARQIFTNARMTLGFVRSEITELETAVSVRRVASRPVIDRKMAAAGDHSLEEEAGSDGGLELWGGVVRPEQAEEGRQG